MRIRNKIAVAILFATSTTVGCKTPMPWSKAEPAGATAASPNVGATQYDHLSKQFSSGSSGSKVGGPTSDDNWIVSNWKKTTAAVAAPFSSSGAVDTDDAVSLSNSPSKVGPQVYVSAAQLLENQGKFAEAEAKYEAALKGSPKDLNTLVSLARCYDRQGKTQPAIESYRKAMKAHPKSALVYNDLGLCYGRTKQPDEAIKNLTKATELEPQNARYRNNLAVVLVENDRTDEALVQLIAVNPEAVAHYNLACLLQSHGRNDLAVTQLQVAVQKDGNLAQAHDLLAQLQPSTNGRVSALPASTGGATPPTGLLQASPAAPYGGQPAARSSGTKWR